MIPRTKSTSSSVLSRPSEKQIEPWQISGGTPIAVSTCDEDRSSSSSPLMFEEQADPDAAQTPCVDSQSSRDSPSTYSIQKERWPGRRRVGWPVKFMYS